ncbi:MULTISPECIES: DUF3300 domain-containing protein [unclassified Serratia (in: enterobacteria)]|uniref:DUF3300 domain-containing protein n=1 Tax=unclassified Serratia (in: enterobacteria) TaxID=2647522 RepID=UPI002ED6B7BB|nr:DUF3300 domain-containing protein [Serratia sp. C2(2)]MEE4447310.1 DUF3300 domain-containing protein [Serratia sp. C2(1)]
MRKSNCLTGLICLALLPLSGCDQKSVAGVMGVTQPVAAPAYTPLSADQLYQLVSPVALFPDKLLAQVLAGAGYPDQISAADNWLAQNRSLQPAALTTAADAQPWDPSVRSLVQFPDVLDQMAKNLPWTSALGNAYANDPTDVMNAVQVMRQRAANKGTLKSSPQQRVVIAPIARTLQQPYQQTVVAAPDRVIVIEPSQPDVVYVPRYDPWVAYGEAVPIYPGYHYQPASGYSGGDMLAAGVISFGVGIAVGALLNQHDNSWHNWDVHWNDRRQPVIYNNAPYISHSTTVINRVSNINQYNNVNRTTTLNNYNTRVNQAPHFVPTMPTAERPAPNFATMAKPHFAPQQAGNAHPPVGMPAFTLSAPPVPHPAMQPNLAHQPMNTPNFNHSAPAVMPQHPRAKSPILHPADNRATHQSAPLAAVPHPGFAPSSAAQFHQQQEPHRLILTAKPQEQHRLIPAAKPQEQHRLIPAAKPQEHRPLKPEEHKVG